MSYVNICVVHVYELYITYVYTYKYILLYMYTRLYVHTSMYVSIICLYTPIIMIVNNDLCGCVWYNIYLIFILTRTYMRILRGTESTHLTRV